jgi:hypothetical protein
MFPQEKLDIIDLGYYFQNNLSRNTFEQVTSALHQLFSVEWDENGAPQGIRLFSVGQGKGISRHWHHVQPARLSFPRPAENLK